ncbi:hypothetical protein GF325_10255 [Candidatus Bathyarchaeota archaeon]|nr:hypothetical protein [Candidatus Bathyarchaeota archaeon]
MYPQTQLIARSNNFIVSPFLQGKHGFAFHDSTPARNEPGIFATKFKSGVIIHYIPSWQDGSIIPELGITTSRDRANPL